MMKARGTDREKVLLMTRHAVRTVVFALLPLSAYAAPPYQSMTVRNFVIDGPKLAARHVKVKLFGAYILQGKVGALYADTQAVMTAKYSNGGTQPSVALLTDDASHELRATLLFCDSNPVTAQTGCEIEIRGRATMCETSNAFGALSHAPCIDAEDGGYPPPAPLQPEIKPSAAAQSLTDDLTPVRNIDAQAALHMAYTCHQDSQGDAQREARCRSQEMNAWQRLVPGNEFPTITQAIINKCQQPPFPDTFVAHEACARYELGR